MSNKPNILQKSSGLRNSIITVLIILILLFGVLILYFLFSKKEVKVTNRMPYMELYGDPIVIMGENETYSDDGFYAYDLEDGDLTKFVKIQSNLTNKPGIYTITYVSNDSGKQSAVKTRTVVVESDEFEVDFKLRGSKVIFLKKGNNFTEPGFTSYHEGKDLNDAVKILGEVDGSKEGEYTIYYVLENNKEVKVLTRKVIVLASSIASLTEEENKYISNYNIKELKNNYKIKPEHFTSKIKLILAFSLCENDGNLTDSEITTCLSDNLGLENTKISHSTKYELIDGVISYNESAEKWVVSYPKLLKELENNFENMNDNLKLVLDNDNYLYIYIEYNNNIYRYTFTKQEDKITFVSVEIV